MRSRLIAPSLSEQEAGTVARFDAAPDAEESLRERVAQAIRHAAFRESSTTLDMADAAIAVMRGDDA